VAVQVFLWLAALYPYESLALDPNKKISQYALDVWQEKEGLPQLTVNTILQTKDGYLWVGTNEGLYRFDGVTFTLISDEASGFKYNEIYALEEDKESGLWIGYRGGVGRLKDKKITVYPQVKNTVKAIIKDKDWNIWIGTYVGLYQFNYKEIITHKKSNGENIIDIKALYCDLEGTIWIGTNRPMYIYKNGRVSDLSTIDEGAKEIRKINSISGSKDGTVLLITKEGTLFRYKNGKYSFHDLRKNSSEHAMLTAIGTDVESNIWIGTREKGLCRLENDQLVPYFNPDIPFLMSHVISLYTDREGSLWIGTEVNGLARLRDIDVVSYTAKDGLVGSRVSVVFEDSKRNIWVGTSNGINSISKNGVDFYQNDTARFDVKLGTVTYSIIETFDGKILAGTNQGVYELKDGKFVHTFKDIIGDGEVRQILQDRNNGLWISNRAMGLIYIKDGKPIKYTNDDGYRFSEIRTLFEDKRGDIWIASVYNGLVQMRDGKIINLLTPDMMDNDTVASVHEDKEGTLWIASPKGLTKYKDKKIVKYDVKDGLPTSDLIKLFEDDNNNLWLGTSSKGIFRLSKQEIDDYDKGKVKTLNPTIYNTRDGLSANNCTRSGFKTKDGILLFGTIKGLVSINPKKLHTNLTVPPIHIEAVIANKKNVDVIDGLKILPGQGDLEIRYTGLSYLIPERVRFKYRLEGFDNEWIDVGTRRVAYYTNLPPGKYQFQVIACNNDGIWNSVPSSLSFTLLPHFYQTNWFYALCSFVIFAFSWRIYQIRIRHLQRSRDAALEASRLKSAFLTTISHELRTPLNGVIGMSNLLMDTPLSPDQAECAETIKSSSEALLAVINDILDFTRIEAGKMNLQMQPFDLQECVEETTSFLSVGVNSKGLVLATLVYSDVPTSLCGDKGRLRQILTNLIGNAIKFTEQGYIAVRISKLNETATHATIRCEISDTGIGIAKEDQSKLFNAFTQLDGSAARRYEGTGLGLAISKQLVERLGGEIGVNSEKGNGSTFWFTARFEKQTKTQQEQLAAPQISNLKTLILCEHEIVKDVLQHHCMQWGVDESIASSHEEAIEKLRLQARLDQAFDLLILEIASEPTNVENMVRSIKADPVIDKTKILVVAPHSRKWMNVDLSSIGIIESLTMPLKQEKLFECLNRIKVQDSFYNKPVLPCSAESMNCNAHPVTKQDHSEIDQGNVRILLAEDNLVNQKVAIRMLEKLGYKADIAENGKVVLEALSKKDYDIILMDCMMPEMDGYEATQEIRKREKSNKHTKIIAMTANALVGDREKCLEAGMDDYLSKPVKVSDLDQMIKHWVSQSYNESQNNLPLYITKSLG
jgi:signal transduction histidine kinase/ligand-binding sensor domain-containing protein/DNA-binding response OmpR family regulator